MPSYFDKGNINESSCRQESPPLAVRNGFLPRFSKSQISNCIIYFIASFQPPSAAHRRLVPA